MYLHNQVPLDYFAALNNYALYYIIEKRLRKLSVSLLSVFLPETKLLSYNAWKNKKEKNKEKRLINCLHTI